MRALAMERGLPIMSGYHNLKFVGKPTLPG